jgi:hypothetical protein
MKNLTKIILLVLSLCLTLIAKDVATITGVTGKAFIQRDGTQIGISLGVVLKEKDTILTDDKAKVQIIFKDETIVTIGKNSNFSISEYLYEDDQEPVVKFSMLKGAMRTITGKIGKIAPEKFTVTAKTATIGIRGTNFSVIVEENGNTEVYCTFGAISITVNGTIHVVEQGLFIIVQPDGNIDIKAFKPKELKKMKEKFAKSISKKGSINDDAIVANDKPLDNTTQDFDNITIKDISNSAVDAEQIGNLADILSGYTMNDAVYNGTFTNDGVNTTGKFQGGNGTVQMDVNFGNDTLALIFTGSSAPSSSITLNEKSTFSGTNFSIQNVDSNGIVSTANGTFNGATGNNATGTYKLIGESNTYDTGTYEVNSIQTLH